MKIKVDYRKIYYVLKELESLYMLYQEDTGKESRSLNTLFRCVAKWDDMQTVFFDLEYLEHLGYLKPTGKKAKDINIGLFLLLFKGLFPEERILTVKVIRKVLDHKSFLYGQETVKAMQDENAKYQKKNDESVLLFRGSLGNYMAFGSSADRLFEELGWQTTTVTYEGEQYSCMMLSEYGYQVASELLPCYMTMTQLEIDNLKYDDEADVLFSLDQQLIDFFRKIAAKKGIMLPTRGVLDSCVNMTEDDKKTKMRFPFLKVFSDSLLLYSDKASPCLLVNGRSWIVDYTDIMMVNKIADLLYFALIIFDDDWTLIGKKEIEHGMECVAKFNAIKKQYPDMVLVMDYSSTFESYGDDAVWLSLNYRIPLWRRKSSDGHSVPMVMMHQELVNKIMEKESSVVLESSKLEDSEDIMALWPHELNPGLLDETKYKRVSIYKRKDGKYVLKASLKGKDLPPKVQNDMIVELYNCYPKGVMREAVMKHILWYNYTVDVRRGEKG